MAFIWVAHSLLQRAKMRIVFMGTPSYATTILKALMYEDGIEVVLVVTQEDKPVGRKQILTPPDVKAWLLSSDSKTDIYQPRNLKSAESWDKIASYKPDIIVVAAYGQILPREVLSIAPCINLHASLLPKYRGASPIQSMLLNSEPYVGVTSMLMEEGLDTGAILGFSYLKSEAEHNAACLFPILADEAASLCIKTLKAFDILQPLVQVNADSSHCKKIKRDDGLISFELSSSTILSHYKALMPWPTIFLESGLKLIDIETSLSHKNAKAGEIIDIQNNGVVVACKDGALLVKRVQPTSKNEMSAVDYIRGKRLIVGDTLV